MRSVGSQHRVVLARLRELTEAGLSPQSLFRELHPVLQNALGFDAGCWHENDPVTGVPTSTVADGLDPEGFAQAVRLELWSDDSTTFAMIRRSGRRAETVVRATAGIPDRSVRYRELLSAFGFTDELRVTFDQDGYWGSAAFMRSRGLFSPAALRLAEHVSRQVSAALRAHAMPMPAEEVLPAVFVVSPANTVVTATAEAEVLLARLSDDQHQAGALPTGLALAAEEARRGVRSPGVLVKTGDGRWVTAYGSRFGADVDGQVVVVVTPASPTAMLPLALRVRGLSQREQQVALQVIRGRSTKEIARLLHLTAGTVQDHLTSIFDKTGVRSRRELVALLAAPTIGG